ncbi:hypothetical protein [Bacillus piscicola]|uniref:hypothetical protein n=1 Tax=Bacillus piscicola TaxID=1632684 RepID=UPI001F09CB98|nr:hypothetical protein [Bacillus piscicola]
MKIFTKVAALSVLLTLSACGGDEEEKAEQQQSEDSAPTEEAAASAETEEETEPAIAEEEEEEPAEPEDGVLTEVGQTVDEEHYSLELLAISDEEQTTNIGPVEIKLHDAKVFAQEVSDTAFEQLYSMYASDKNFTTVQLTATITNTGEEAIGVSPVETVVLSTGQQLEYDTNEVGQYEKSLYGDYFDGVTKEGHYVFVIDGEVDVNNLEWIRVITGNTFNPEDYSTINEGTEMQFDL